MNTSPIPRASYHREIPGPDLVEPFQVTHGVVVIVLLGSSRTVVIPTGGAWPGLDALPARIHDHLQPSHSAMIPGTVIRSGLSAEQLPAALALIVAQGLTSIGLTAERLQFAEQIDLPMQEMNRQTAADVIGVSREQMSAHIGKPR